MRVGRLGKGGLWLGGEEGAEVLCDLGLVFLQKVGSLVVSICDAESMDMLPVFAVVLREGRGDRFETRGWEKTRGEREAARGWSRGEETRRTV